MSIHYHTLIEVTLRTCIKRLLDTTQYALELHGKETVTRQELEALDYKIKQIQILTEGLLS